MSKLKKIFSKLGKHHLSREETMDNEATMKLQDIGIKGKVFCLSMQRSGTSSVGDFLEQWGLKRAGHQLSRKQQWSRHWYNGNYEAIFSDPVFQQHEVFEDDPFWFPDFYKFIHHRVPDSRFILLYRDSDAWFKSMIRHSNGFSLGQTDIHAKIYRREDELIWLEKNIPGFKGTIPKSMTLFDKASHYKSTYERHIVEIEKFFHANQGSALFMSELSDVTIWSRLKEWLVLPEKDGVSMNVHSHKARSEFTNANLLQTIKQVAGQP